MKLQEIHHYDTYVPILADKQQSHTWGAGGGHDYGNRYNRLVQSIAVSWTKGCVGRWCDRYPNQGKQSGAFSCGTYDADPFYLDELQANRLE